jgi:hypothetical protein
MGAVMPPRLGVQTGRTGKNVPTLTRFTPGLKAGILSLTKDRELYEQLVAKLLWSSGTACSSDGEFSLSRQV